MDKRGAEPFQDSRTERLPWAQTHMEHTFNVRRGLFHWLPRSASTAHSSPLSAHLGVCGKNVPKLAQAQVHPLDLEYHNSYKITILMIWLTQSFSAERNEAPRGCLIGRRFPRAAASHMVPRKDHSCCRRILVFTPPPKKKIIHAFFYSLVILLLQTKTNRVYHNSLWCQNISAGICCWTRPLEASCQCMSGDVILSLHRMWNISVKEHFTCNLFLLTRLKVNYFLVKIIEWRVQRQGGTTGAGGVWRRPSTRPLVWETWNNPLISTCNFLPFLVCVQKHAEAHTVGEIGPGEQWVHWSGEYLSVSLSMPGAPHLLPPPLLHCSPQQ